MEINTLKNHNENRKGLKIYKKYFKRFNGYLIFPEIRLSGKWLQKNGFTVGQKVRVTHEANRILIRTEEKIRVVL